MDSPFRIGRREFGFELFPFSEEPEAWPGGEKDRPPRGSGVRAICFIGFNELPPESPPLLGTPRRLFSRGPRIFLF